MTPVRQMCAPLALSVLMSGVCHRKSIVISVISDPPAKVTPSSMFLVADIHVQGNRQVTTESIKSAIHITPGAQANRLDVDADVQRLLALNFFTDVKVELEAAATGGLVVVFSVFEKYSLNK